MLDYSIIISTLLPDRQTELNELCKQLDSKKIHYIINNDDNREGLISNHIKSFKLAINAKWLIHLQDDIILSKDFKIKCLNIYDYPKDASMITFYSNLKEIGEAIKDNIKYKNIQPSKFCMMQGIAIKTDIIDSFIRYIPMFYKNNPQHKNAFDLCLGKYFSIKKYKIYATIPCYVQHRNCKSTITSHNVGNRQTRWFKDDLYN